MGSSKSRSKNSMVKIHFRNDEKQELKEVWD